MDADNTSQLPALQPPAALILQRTQTTLELLREVVQESSAEYWYERGKKAGARQEWVEALAAFQACIVRDPNHWRATLQMTITLVQQNRYETAASALEQAYYLPYLESKEWKSELSTNEWQMLRTSFEGYQEVAQNKFSILLALIIIPREASSNDFLAETLDLMKSLYPLQIKKSPTWYVLSGCLVLDLNYYKTDEAWFNFFKYAIEIAPDNAAVY